MFEIIKSKFKDQFETEVLDFVCALESAITDRNYSRIEEHLSQNSPDDQTKREYAFLLLYLYDCKRIISMTPACFAEVLGLSKTEILFIALTSELDVITTEITRHPRAHVLDLDVLFLPSQHDKTKRGSSYFYNMVSKPNTREILNEFALESIAENSFLTNPKFIPSLLELSTDNMCPLHYYLADPEGCEMLTDLLKKERGVARLRIHPNFMDRIFVTYNEWVMLPWVLAYPEGELLLNQLLSNKQIQTIVDGEFYWSVLAVSIPANQTEWLLKTELGRRFLLKNRVKNWVLNDPNLISLLLTENYEHPPLLYSVLTDPNGPTIIKQFISAKEVKDRLELDPRFKYALSYCPEKKLSTLGLFCQTRKGAALLNELLSRKMFRKTLTEDPVFISQLLACHPNGTPKLYSILCSDSGHKALDKLCSDPEFRKKLVNHPDFITRLLTECPNETSAFYFLTYNTNKDSLLATILDDETTKKALLEDPLFVHVLTRYSPTEKFSVLTHLSETPYATTAIEKILEPSIRERLLNHPDFIQTLVGDPDKVEEFGLESLVSVGCIYTPHLNRLITDTRFIQGLSHCSAFIPKLLAEKTTRYPALTCFIDCGLDLFFPDEPLATPLIEHEAFFRAVFAQPSDTVKRWQHQSHFRQMINHFYGNCLLLNRIFCSIFFKTWIQEQVNLTCFIQALFTEHPAGSSLPANAFHMLLAKDTKKALIKHLLDIPPVRAAIFEQLGISGERAALAVCLFNSAEGYALLKRLLEAGHTAVLDTTTVKSLFKNLVIQQMIHLQRIDPAWFLYIALHGENPREDLAFILKQPIIFPWSPDVTGRYPYHVIDDLNLPDSEKRYLNDLVDAAGFAYRKNNTNALTSLQQTRPESPIAMDEMGASEESSREKRVKAGSDDEALRKEQPSQPDEIASIHALLETLQPVYATYKQKNEEHIVQGDLNLILERCVNWILLHETLSSYHPMFNTLLQNNTFRSTDDFMAVVNHLISLISAMKTRLDTGDVPLVDARWQLGDCTIMIIDTLVDIQKAFEGISPVKYYENEVVKSQITAYNKLFAVPKTMEVHAPSFTIMVLLGQAPMDHHPFYDPYKLQWSPHQHRCVLQSIASIKLEAKPWLYDEQLRPLIAMFLNALTPQPSFVDIGELTADKPWMLCLQGLNSSKLFEKELVISDLFTLLHLDINEKKLCCTISDVEKTRDKFLQEINKRFNSWYEKQALPQEKIIRLYSELLWLYLMDKPRECNKAIDNLLQKLPHVIDAGALIQYTLMQHKEELDRLNIAQLFKMIPGHPVSFFSLLISNPFYSAWLFGYRMNVSRKKNEREEEEAGGEVTLDFESTEDLAGIKGRFDKEENKEAFLSALELAIAQPGTLFFWLYFFSQETLRQELYHSIKKFILSSENHLFGYDSLLPVFYDMLHSSLLDDEEKTRVRSFLEQRIEETLKIKAQETYWSVVCTLLDGKALEKKVEHDRRKHPWLTLSSELKAYTNQNEPLSARTQLTFFSSEGCVVPSDTSKMASPSP